MLDWLEGCRARIGQPPRAMNWFERWYLSPRLPGWVHGSGRTDLLRNAEQQIELLRSGHVRWAALVQANQLLFEAGSVDAPAELLTSLDPFFDDEAHVLLRAAHELFLLKNTEPEDPLLSQIAENLTNECTSPESLGVPLSYTAGHPAFLREIMVYRRNLPGAHLSSSLVPVLIDDVTTAMMILPLKFWPDDLSDAFRAGYTGADHRLKWALRL